MNEHKTCYRIYVEDTGKTTELLDFVDGFFDNYTVFLDCGGSFKGFRESSLVIEYIGEDTHTCRIQVRELAKQLKEWYNQQSVLVTAHTVLQESI